MCQVHIRSVAVSTIILGVLVLLACLAWFLAIGVGIDFENTHNMHFGKNLEGESVNDTYWQWIYAAPAFVTLFGIMTVAAGSVIVRDPMDRRMTRAILGGMVMCAALLLPVAAALLGAWGLFSQQHFYAYGRSLRESSCLDDFPVATCGEENNANPNWVWTVYRRAHTGLLASGAIALSLSIFAVLVAALLLVCHTGEASRQSMKKHSYSYAPHPGKHPSARRRY